MNTYSFLLNLYVQLIFCNNCNQFIGIKNCFVTVFINRNFVSGMLKSLLYEHKLCLKFTMMFLMLYETKNPN